MYDINGNKISSSASISSSDIKTALVGAVADGSVNLGSVIGATLSYTSPSTTWEENGTIAYNMLLEKYKTMPNVGVPFFISTDQHGRGVEVNRWCNNIDVDGINIANLNLGDTVTDVYNITQLESMYSRTKQVKNYIGVVGNHDKLYKNETVLDYEINRCFLTTFNEKKIKETENCYVVYDGKHSVKYIVLDTFDVADDGLSFTWGITSNVANWLIDELSKNDGYDVMFLSHYPSYQHYQTRENATEVTSGTSSENSNNTHKVSIWNMLIARKNKTSGTLTDMNNGTHAYDFTNCESDILVQLSGHDHAEQWSVDDGFTNYACTCLSDNYVCVFGLIDRENDKMYIYKFDKTQAYDELEIKI